MTHRVALIAMVSLTVALGTASAELPNVPSGPGDWPQWRGPNRDGIGLDTGLAKQWPAAGPPVVAARPVPFTGPP